jgi:hypothetical protein
MLNQPRIVNLNFEDRTSSQLKNAGNMRLIRNKAVADSIRNYWSTIKIMESISSRLEELGGKSQDVAVQMFNNKYVVVSNKRDPMHSTTSVFE